MPNIKSQKKRVNTNNKRALVVKSKKSEIKTGIKKVLAAVEAKDAAAAKEALNNTNKLLDASLTGKIHNQSYVSRQKSRLAKAVNAIA